jgi:hypothetical protein
VIGIFVITIHLNTALAFVINKATRYAAHHILKSNKPEDIIEAYKHCKRAYYDTLDLFILTLNDRFVTSLVYVEDLEKRTENNQLMTLEIITQQALISQSVLQTDNCFLLFWHFVLAYAFLHHFLIYYYDLLIVHFHLTEFQCRITKSQALVLR